MGQGGSVILGSPFKFSSRYIKLITEGNRILGYGILNFFNKNDWNPITRAISIRPYFR